jgi:hypothetical protein
MDFDFISFLGNNRQPPKSSTRYQRMFGVVEVQGAFYTSLSTTEGPHKRGKRTLKGVWVASLITTLGNYLNTP